MRQFDMFAIDNRLASLSKIGDPLERMNQYIKWEAFQPIVDRVFAYERKSEAGRPPYDYLVMLKVLVLQSLYNISDDQMEYQLRDRLSFMRFVGLGMSDRVPDAKTIWLYREALTKAGVIRDLFNRFERFLKDQGYQAQKGQIVDASIVEVPKQRNTKTENDVIKSGEVPEGWAAKPAKLRQKDVAARWFKKHDENHFGYKNHANVDVKHKLIREYAVTSGNVHDSEVFADVLDKDNTGRGVWADSAYRAAVIESFLRRRKLRSNIHRKGYRDNPLSKFQVCLNSKKSKIRARVEHAFGFMVNSMKANLIRCVGIIRAEAKIGINNLVYNLSRYVQLERMA
jgi:IS5 family transposase